MPIIYYFYPETGHRSLEEVDVIFSEASKKGNPWLSVISTAKCEPVWFDRHGCSSNGYSSVAGLESSKEKAGAGDSDASTWASNHHDSSRSEGSGRPLSSEPPVSAPPNDVEAGRGDDGDVALPSPVLSRSSLPVSRRDSMRTI